jgi:hypothetical protein
MVGVGTGGAAACVVIIGWDAGDRDTTVGGTDDEGAWGEGVAAACAELPSATTFIECTAVSCDGPLNAAFSGWTGTGDGAAACARGDAGPEGGNPTGNL